MDKKESYDRIETSRQETQGGLETLVGKRGRSKMHEGPKTGEELSILDGNGE